MAHQGLLQGLLSRFMAFIWFLVVVRTEISSGVRNYTLEALLTTGEYSSIKEIPWGLFFQGVVYFRFRVLGCNG